MLVVESHDHIFRKYLVEVADTEEENSARMLPLHLAVLPHERRLAGILRSIHCVFRIEERVCGENAGAWIVRSFQSVRFLRRLLPLVSLAKSGYQFVWLDLIGVELVKVLVGDMQLPLPHIPPMLPLGIVRMRLDLV